MDRQERMRFAGERRLKLLGSDQAHGHIVGQLVHKVALLQSGDVADRIPQSVWMVEAKTGD